MAKYLVTGLVSRQANAQKNKRDVMVSWMLAEALRDMGHEVEHRNPTMTEDYDEFDHVFLGLAAMHSVGANRSYGWLAAYLKNFAQGKVTFYLDDVDTAKVLSGLRVMKNDPAKLVKPFYVYRLEYELAVQPQWYDWLMQGINLLNDYAWPTVIVPMFPWGDINAYRAQLPNAIDVVPIDFTPYVPQYITDDDWQTPRERAWISELKPDDRWFEQQRPVYEVKHFAPNCYKRPEDHGLVLEYAKNWGVLERGLDNGFFHSRVVYAAQARSLFISRWQNVQALGDSYALLADTAAGLTEDNRTAWAEAQAASLNALTWTREQVKDVLASLTNVKVDA